MLKKKKKKKFRFKEEDFKVEQSLPSYLIFPMQTEMSCQKAFTRDLKHKKQKKKTEKNLTDRVEFVQENLKGLCASLHM